MVATARRPQGHAKSEKRAKHDAFVEQYKGMKLLGEVITWELDAATHSHKGLLDALRKAELSTDPAKEILPRHAFTRASKKLVQEKVIDELGHDGDLISFQFTKRTTDGKEWKYAKHAVLVLNKETGAITCNDKQLEAFAQEELNKAIEARTTADVTKIIQKLFDAEAELFPIRGQGGVYFVLAKFEEFVNKIETFVKQLGGHVNRFPIPEGTERGDRSVTDAIVNGLNNVVDELSLATDGFDVTTRSDTLERQAKRIKEAKVKVEAYANLLQDRAQELLDAVETENEKLRNKIAKIASDKASAPASVAGEKRSTLHGHSITAVIRWMASQGWKFVDVKKVLGTFADIVVSEATIRAQVGGWKDRGEPAKLTKDQQKDLVTRKEKE